MTRRWSVVLVGLVALVGGGCGGGSDAASTTTAAPTTSVATTTAAPTTTNVPTTASPDSTVAATTPATPNTVAAAAGSSSTSSSTTTTSTTTTSSPTVSTTTTAAPVAGLPTQICVSLMQDAVAQGATIETIDLFYPALAECLGLDDWVAAAGETNALDNIDPVQFASLACSQDGPFESVTCQEALEVAPEG